MVQIIDRAQTSWEPRHLHGNLPLDRTRSFGRGGGVMAVGAPARARIRLRVGGVGRRAATAGLLIALAVSLVLALLALMTLLAMNVLKRKEDA